MCMKIAALCASLVMLPAWAAGEAIVVADNDLDAFFGPRVELATGYDRPQKLAPAVVETISREEIASLGAVSFDEIMQRAAGVVVEKNRVNDPVFVFRGVYNELNPQVLIMIDGSPISDPVAGGRPIAWNMLSPAIERIEIIRGPGSAVFGADAFTGVVNIITKGAVRDSLSEIGAFGGNFGTFGGYGLKTFDIAGARANFTLQGKRTAGDREQIAIADAQSLFDLLAGTSASNAPAALRTDRSEVAARFNLKASDSVALFLSYDGFFNTGSAFASTFQASDFNEFNNHLLAGGGSYNTSIGRAKVGVKGRVLLNSLSARTLVAPAGAFSPPILGLLPFDLKSQFDYRSIDARLEADVVRDFGRHTIRLGGGGAHQRGYDIVDSRNFLITPFGLAPAPSSDLVNVLTLGQMPNSSGSKRTIAFAFVQDEWRVSPEVTLTAGLRFDHYTEFGGTVNPRASLVWAPNLTTTIKLLYGAAFRAPTFLEYRTNPGGVVVGNPTLVPETIDTVELEVSHRFSDGVSGSVSGFYFQSDDTIAVVNTPAVPTFNNTAGFEGHGLEAALDISASKKIRVKGHYAYQDVVMRDTRMRHANAPAHSAFVDITLAPTEAIDVNLIGSYVGKRPREFGDPRPALDGYLRADAVMTWRPAGMRGVEASIAVRNLFGENYSDPSTSFLLAPGDFPREGRSIIARLSTSF